MDLKKRYDRLTVIGPEERDKNNYRVRVRCDCGVETYVWVNNLKSGATQSCGCKKAEQVAERLKKQAAERARETTERVEAEKRLKKLKHEIRQIAKDWVTISNITNPVLNEIDNVANEIEKEAWREVQCKCEPWELRLSHGEISVAEHNRHVQPILDENKTFDEKANGEKNHVENIWWEIVASAERKGREAIVPLRERLSEALFSRVTSAIVAGRSTKARRKSRWRNRATLICSR